jgi:hypothetical protein
MDSEVLPRFNPSLPSTFSFFSEISETEVPMVNKPRRACLYFHSHMREKKLNFSAPFSHANGNQLGDE